MQLSQWPVLLSVIRTLVTVSNGAKQLIARWKSAATATVVKLFKTSLKASSIPLKNWRFRPKNAAAALRATRNLGTASTGRRRNLSCLAATLIILSLPASSALSLIPESKTEIQAASPMPDSGVLQIETPRAFAPLLKPARYKGAHGGRASAKSHFFAGLMIEENISDRQDNVCLREVQKSLEFSVKKLLESKIAQYNAGSYFEVQDRRIFTRPASGGSGIIIFEGLQNHTAESIKSFENFKRALIEEAQSLSQRSLDILRPTIRAPGSEMWFAWNPNLPSDPVDSLFRGDTPPPDSTVIEVSYRDNPWLSDEIKAEIAYDKKRDPDKFAHVWLGGYQQHSEARVFKNWRVEEFDINPTWIMRQGADWGFSVDPSVLVQCCIEGKTLYVPYECYMVGCEIDLLPDLFMTVPDAERWPTVADSSRPETVSYMQKHGFPRMLSAVKGARSVEEGIEFLRSFDIVVHPRCRHLIDELTLYCYKRDKLTDAILPQLEDKDNHVIDALRYACEGARRNAALKPKPRVQRTFHPAAWQG